eukprot:TRINITY_DN7473_c0_g1_i1.p1 TRINITY_DN7473_c0_g1~~TRINITY_DN7473_c0_g1_i1.p1  ORF type:complete len:736 (-),score=75.08 TRINITY_DN7473_c0_g1_i1:168-2375(-)
MMATRSVPAEARPRSQSPNVSNCTSSSWILPLKQAQVQAPTHHQARSRSPQMMQPGQAPSRNNVHEGSKPVQVRSGIWSSAVSPTRGRQLEVNSGMTPTKQSAPAVCMPHAMTYSPPLLSGAELSRALKKQRAPKSSGAANVPKLDLSRNLTFVRMAPASARSLDGASKALSPIVCKANKNSCHTSKASSTARPETSFTMAGAQPVVLAGGMPASLQLPNRPEEFKYKRTARSSAATSFSPTGGREKMCESLVTTSGTTQGPSAIKPGNLPLVAAAQAVVAKAAMRSSPTLARRSEVLRYGKTPSHTPPVASVGWSGTSQAMDAAQAMVVKVVMQTPHQLVTNKAAAPSPRSSSPPPRTINGAAQGLFAMRPEASHAIATVLPVVAKEVMPASLQLAPSNSACSARNSFSPTLRTPAGIVQSPLATRPEAPQVVAAVAAVAPKKLMPASLHLATNSSALSVPNTFSPAIVRNDELHSIPATNTAVQAMEAVPATAVKAVMPAFVQLGSGNSAEPVLACESISSSKVGNGMDSNLASTSGAARGPLATRPGAAVPQPMVAVETVPAVVAKEMMPVSPHLATSNSAFSVPNSYQPMIVHNASHSHLATNKAAQGTLQAVAAVPATAVKAGLPAPVQLGSANSAEPVLSCESDSYQVPVPTEGCAHVSPTTRPEASQAMNTGQSVMPAASAEEGPRFSTRKTRLESCVSEMWYDETIPQDQQDVAGRLEAKMALKRVA